MNSEDSPILPLEHCKRILVVLPDDGTDLRVIEGLRSDKGITRAYSLPVRAVAALQEAKAKRGRLPEPILARLVTVVVAAAEADAVFDYIYTTANLDRPGGGMALMERAAGATPFTLPSDISEAAE